jgi:hypothetical protein
MIVLETFRVHSRTRWLVALLLLVERLDALVLHSHTHGMSKGAQTSIRQVPLEETQHHDSKTRRRATVESVLLACSNSSSVAACQAQCVYGKMSRSAAELSPCELEFWAGRLSTFKVAHALLTALSLVRDPTHDIQHQERHHARQVAAKHDRKHGIDLVILFGRVEGQ